MSSSSRSPSSAPLVQCIIFATLLIVLTLELSRANKKTDKRNREAIEADVALLVRQVIRNSDKEFIIPLFFKGISKEKYRLCDTQKRQHRETAQK